MKKCKVTIITTVDGQESSIVREGEMTLSAGGACLRYREENALVCILLQGERAEISRNGDYSLFLHLERGQTREGRLGLGGSEGEIGVVAHKVGYSMGKDSLLALLEYDLLFGGETQKMKLRLHAVGEKNED